MAEVIHLEYMKQVAGGADLQCLQCQACGGQVWINMVDGDGCVGVMACAGFMPDGSKCECVIDLDEEVWE